MELLEKRLRDRLELLRAEFALGKQQLQQMKEDQDAKADYLLQVFGAIQVLTEELGDTVDMDFDEPLDLGEDHPDGEPSDPEPTNELRLVDPVVQVDYG
jgi:hypothetical protein